MNIIARHATTAGWSIAINRTSQGYRREMFVVNRVSPDGAMLSLEALPTEAEARKVANRFWKLDR